MIDADIQQGTTQSHDGLVNREKVVAPLDGELR